MSKRYIMTFADVTEANAAITANPEAYAVGTLAVALDTGSVYVSHGGLWVLVGGQV